MPDPIVRKSDASEAQRLRYSESNVTTKRGLTSSSRALLSRRAVAGAEETVVIDIEMEENKSSFAKVTAAEIAFSAQDVKFKPPSRQEVEQMTGMVRALDAMNATQTQADAIIASTTALVGAWRATQA